MTRIAKYELLWLGTILAFTVLIFGGLTRFKFGDIDIVLNDSYYGIPAFYAMTLTFFWLTILVLGIRECKHNFSRKTLIIVLLVDNTLTLWTTGLFLYTLFAASAIGGLIESFSESKTTGDFYSPRLEFIEYIEWTAILVLTILGIFEIILITRLKKINREKRTAANRVDS